MRVFAFVRAYQDRYPIACMCRVLGVSASGYYAWRKRPPSQRALDSEALSRRIAAIHADLRQTYGARRVHAELKAQGVRVSRQRVARLMRGWLSSASISTRPSSACSTPESRT